MKEYLALTRIRQYCRFVGVCILFSRAHIANNSHSKTMDELFLLPPVPLALPRAYWIPFEKREVTSLLLLIQPSPFEWNRVQKAMKGVGAREYDMEIIDNLYRDSAMILPHRPYAMQTGEMRNTHIHKSYMGSAEEPFDPDAVMNETKLIHFSDWPVPKASHRDCAMRARLIECKPWLPADPELIEDKKPKCIHDTKANSTDCRQQKLWLGFYEDFARRRKVCSTKQFSKRR